MESGQEQSTYYDILHIQRNAPLPIVKNAYRALMMNMKQHPDLGGDSQRAALINLAYETLSDEHKRAEYDQMLAEQEAAGNTGSGKKRRPEPAQPQSTNQSARAENFANARTGARCVFCYKFHNAPSGELMDCGGCGSPLDPPPSGLHTENAERSIERIPKNTSIEVTGSPNEKPQLANLKDLSPQGLGFVSQSNLSQQQIVKVSCPLFEGLANIVHIRPEASGGTFYGAQFQTLRFHRQSGNFISMRL